MSKGEPPKPKDPFIATAEAYNKAHETYEQVKKEIAAQTDRGAAIIASSLLDNSLERALKVRLLPMNYKLRENFFGGRGILGTFSSKIDTGFVVGLYPENAHFDLTQIRRIRNEFAHSINPLSFEEASIKDICSLMPYRDSRQRFLGVFLALYAHLTDMELSPLTQMKPLPHPNQMPRTSMYISMTPITLVVGKDGLLGIEPEPQPVQIEEKPKS